MGEKVAKPTRMVSARRAYRTLPENLPDLQRNAPAIKRRWHRRSQSSGLDSDPVQAWYHDRGYSMGLCHQAWDTVCGWSIPDSHLVMMPCRRYPAGNALVLHICQYYLVIPCTGSLLILPGYLLKICHLRYSCTNDGMQVLPGYYSAVATCSSCSI